MIEDRITIIYIPRYIYCPPRPTFVSCAALVKTNLFLNMNIIVTSSTVASKLTPNRKCIRTSALSPSLVDVLLTNHIQLKFCFLIGVKLAFFVSIQNKKVRN